MMVVGDVKQRAHTQPHAEAAQLQVVVENLLEAMEVPEHPALCLVLLLLVCLLVLCLALLAVLDLAQGRA